MMETRKSVRRVDVVSRRVVEANVNAGSTLGCNWAIIEQYDGDRYLNLSLAGDAVEDASTGVFDGRAGATIRFADVDTAAAFGAAIIAAAQQAKEIGLRAPTEAEHFAQQRKGA